MPKDGVVLNQLLQICADMQNNPQGNQSTLKILSFIREKNLHKIDLKKLRMKRKKLEIEISP